jgi:AraC-like DNA-binding protein
MLNKPILIIAEKENSKLYRAMSLKNKDVHISTFNDAFNVERAYNLEIAVIDCVSNINQGLMLLGKLKSVFPRILIIFLSDIVTGSLVMKAYKMGSRIFLKKPVNIIELETEINELLQHKKTSREKRIQYNEITNHNDIDSSINDIIDIPENMYRVLGYIENNLSNNISISCLSQEANLSKYHFCRKFKQCFGISPMKYVISLRIEKAKSLLRIVDYNISQVIYETGFNDHKTFLTHFKRITGLTPSKYKESLIEKKRVRIS